MLLPAYFTANVSVKNAVLTEQNDAKIQQQKYIKAMNGFYSFFPILFCVAGRKKEEFFYSKVYAQNICIDL
jgi:hypothetical protein